MIALIIILLPLSALLGLIITRMIELICEYNITRKKKFSSIKQFKKYSSKDGYSYFIYDSLKNTDNNKLRSTFKKIREEYKAKFFTYYGIETTHYLKYIHTHELIDLYKDNEEQLLKILNYIDLNKTPKYDEYLFDMIFSPFYVKYPNSNVSKDIISILENLKEFEDLEKNSFNKPKIRRFKTIINEYINTNVYDKEIENALKEKFKELKENRDKFIASELNITKEVILEQLERI